MVIPEVLSSTTVDVGVFFFSSRRRHTRLQGDWSSDVCSSDLGDEFAVLLPEADAAPARLATDKLRQALAEVVPAHGWRMTASIGVATFLVGIGRGAGRGRVEVSVVVVSFKKKKNCRGGRADDL